MRILAVLFSLLLMQPVYGDLLKDFDSLGGNDELLEQAQAIQGKNQIEIVQKRIVSRRWRHEFSPEFSRVLGGETYLTTHKLGLNYHLHINSRWSLGLRYDYAFNSLTEEANQMISNPEKPQVPEMDWAKTSYQGLINVYPIYGKLNFFNLGIVHFDIYASLGYGQITLRSGPSNTWTAAGGIGMWISQHLTSRFEVRHQNYQAQKFTGAVDMNLLVTSLSFGYML